MDGIESVIFDFDGVLVDSEIISLSELNKSLTHFGLGMPWDDLVETFLGNSDQTIASYIRRQSGQEPGAEYPAACTRRVLDRFSDDLELVSGVGTLLDRLDGQGIPYCIASGSNPGRLAYALDCVGLSDRFQGRAFSADLVAKGKPAPDIFLYSLEQMNKPAHSCLVVEDGIAGAAGAKAAGVGSIIGFVGGSHLAGNEDAHARKLTRAGAHRVIHALSELA